MSNNVILNKPPLCEVYVYGNNNFVEFGNTSKFFKMKIFVGYGDCPAQNIKIHIGSNCLCNGCEIYAFDNGTNINIGDDCLISDGIYMWASDTHTVLDPNGNICNIGKYLNIGNHVWIGKNSSILKNTTIADNSIVGTMSCVSGTFNEKGSVIVGNPAKCIKTGYSWDSNRPNIWLANHN